ncbi:MAG: EI24 domain-containing protein [Rhodocyclaceae bacterium]|nr:EI24 domain-containing protein [Rhodocyclaceae bacterium]
MTASDGLPQAVLSAARDLLRAEMLWHALWPPLVALILWSGIAWFAWLPIAEWVVTQMPEWSWLTWLGAWLAHIAVLFIFAPLVYFTALLLVAVFALPRMMTIVAARDYPDVSRQGSASAALWGSLANTLAAGAIFVIGWLVSLPLLLIPGAVLVLPIFWAAWLNQRAFRFDALAEHALPTERTALIRREKGKLYAAGLISALLAHVPLLNLFSLAFTALLFVHLCLASLRRLRSEKGIQL